jgi:ankyrin repeat protein
MRQRKSGNTRWTAWVFVALAALCVSTALVVCFGPSGHPALHRAVIANDLPRVRELLNSGIGVDLEGPEQTTPLFFARGAEMAKLLIARGADVNATSYYRCSPLHFAAGLGAVDVVEVLLRQGARVDARDSSDDTPLHWAVDRLLRHETGVEDGGWPRTSERALTTTKMLVKHGADVNARDVFGRTPLFGATSGSVELVQFLLASGADARASSTDRHTPLHEAVMAAGSPDRKSSVVRLLLQHGADVHAKDWQGKTARACADAADDELIRLLESFEQRGGSRPSVSAPSAR